MKEEFYKWYPIVDEGEYWTDFDLYIKNEIYYSQEMTKISTIVTDGTSVYTYDLCPYGWGQMAKIGNWKYMRIKLDETICREEQFSDEQCRLNM